MHRRRGGIGIGYALYCLMNTVLYGSALIVLGWAAINILQMG